MATKQKKIAQTEKDSVVQPKFFISNKQAWCVLAGICLTTFVIYFNALSFDFLHVWDDHAYITENEAIRGLQWQNIKLFFTEFYAANYHPLTVFSYAIEYKFVGEKAWLYHFDNIVLHIFNTILVFIFIRKISPETQIVALITAAFFAVHPMHVESVAWVAERKDVLYTFFFLLSLIFYVDYIKANKVHFVFLSGVFFLLSCLSKPAAVVLPLVLFLLDYYLGRKFEWKVVAEKMLFLAISLMFGMIAFRSQEVAMPINQYSYFFNRVLLASDSFIAYIVKAIVPANLSAFYPYPKEFTATLPISYYLSLFLVGVIIFLVWYSLRLGKAVVFGFFFFAITIVLVLQIIAVGNASMADRYTYVPYIGLFFIIGKAVADKIQNRNVILIIGLILFYSAFSVAAFERVKYWKDGEVLFSDVIEKYPDCSTAYNNRGNHYILLAQRSIPFNQNYLRLALADFHRGNISNSEIHRYKGIEKELLNDYSGALDEFNKANQLSPENAKVYYNRGNVRRILGDNTGAMDDYTKAIELFPQYLDAYNNRSLLRCVVKDYNGALADFDKVIEMSPNDTLAIKNRAAVKELIEKAE